MAYKRTGGIVESNNRIVSKYWDTYEKLSTPLASQQVIIVRDKVIGAVAAPDGKIRYEILGNDVTSAATSIVKTNTDIVDSAINTYDATSNTIKSAASGLFKEVDSIANTTIGDAIGNTISSFGGNLFSSSEKPDSVVNIGEKLGLTGGAGAALGENAKGIAEGIGSSTSGITKNVTNYVGAAKDTILAISKIGEELDEILKDTFLGQIFKIKSSEILCALFCIIVSMLPCSTRQQLYQAIVNIRQGIKTANAVNQLAKSPVEVPLFNEKSIQDNVKSLFGNNLQGKSLENALGVPSTSTTKKASVPLQLPPDVLSIVSNIVMVLSVLAKGQITVPVGTSGTIWTFTKTVMAVVQAMVVQMLDEFLTMVIKQVETSLKKMMPQICIGNLASRFINKIIEALKTIKNFYLSQLKELLGSNTSALLKWKTYGWEFKEIQQLLAMIKALSLVLKKFPDLALMCGVTPCNASPSDTVLDIQQAIQTGQLVNETNEPAWIDTYDNLPQGDTLDDLSEVFRELTSNNNACAMTTGDGFCVMLPDMFTDAPRTIQNIVDSDEFRATLGPAYTLFSNSQSQGITIVYTYKTIS